MCACVIQTVFFYKQQKADQLHFLLNFPSVLHIKVNVTMFVIITNLRTAEDVGVCESNVFCYNKVIDSWL